MSKTGSSVPGVPSAANILTGSANTNAATIITIPANRTWQGWVTLTGTLSLAASASAVNTRPTVSIAGSTATPAAGILLGVVLSLAAQTASSTGATTGRDAVFCTIVAGTSSATLTLQTNSSSAASATAAGELIA